MVRHNNRERRSVVQSFLTSHMQLSSRDRVTNTMIVVIKTLYWFLAVGQRFSSTVLFLMIVARCPDKLMCLSYCNIL